MSNSSKIEPFVLKSIEEIEVFESEEESPFISYFDDIQAEFKAESEINKKSQDLKNDKQKTADGGQTVDIEAEVRRIFEDAYKEGEKAGFEMGMKKVEPIIKRLNMDLASIALFKEEMLKRMEELVLELSICFTEALVLKECIEHRETLTGMIKKALEICEDRSHIKIRMRSDDIKYISEENLNLLNIIADDTIDEPGFIIETNFGDIDGRISSQIDELKRHFLEKEKD